MSELDLDCVSQQIETYGFENLKIDMVSKVIKCSEDHSFHGGGWYDALDFLASSIDV